MARGEELINARFIGTHFVDENYHNDHSQLVHRHAAVLELLYIIQGKGKYTVNNREYLLQPGNIVVCNAGILHGETPFQKHSMQSYCCVLNEVSLPNLPPNMLMDEKRTPVLMFQSERVHIERLFIMLHEMSGEASMHNKVCGLLANSLLNIIYTKLEEEGAPKPNNEKKQEELIQNIIEYLDDNYMTPLSLQELGDIFHMSHYYLSHVFKAHTGLSPIKYITHRKIGEAQNYLMNTNMQISEVSEKVGFNDYCHFSALFKKYVGVTPSEYRKHFRG